MSFREVICYIAACDVCHGEAEYDDCEVDCFMDKQCAVDHAGDDWTEVDGKLLCPDCSQKPAE
ncbi:hypothetical protein [Nocardia sp. NPDC049149]|uniref:hypothetical protein n=1 Tax=Nocardia sp. NPDC049149 TaxID=3364315 RepID=UPI00371B4E89